MTADTRYAGTDYGTVEVDLVVCDECAATATTTGLTGWVTITETGISVPAMSDRPTPLHACSQECATRAISLLSWVPTAPR